jgi:hypothetical protein
MLSHTKQKPRRGGGPQKDKNLPLSPFTDPFIRKVDMIGVYKLFDPWMSLLVWLYVLYPEALGNSQTHTQLSLQYVFGLEIIMCLCILSFAYAAVLRPVEVSGNQGISSGHFQLIFSLAYWQTSNLTN